MYASLFLSLPEFLKKETELRLPVVDQLANPQKELVTKYYGFINDPDAARCFGTSDINDYSYWAWRSCGIALLKTIISHFRKESPSLFDIATEIDNNHGYVTSDITGKKDIGWKHSSLIDYLKQHDISANSQTFLSIYHLIFEVFGNQLIIASIQSRLAKNSTHLVIVSGIVKSGAELYLIIHDPYFLDGRGGKRMIAFEEFKNIFLNKGICIK